MEIRGACGLACVDSKARRDTDRTCADHVSRGSLSTVVAVSRCWIGNLLVMEFDMRYTRFGSEP
jgi:hypothetical protein